MPAKEFDYAGEAAGLKVDSSPADVGVGTALPGTSGAVYKQGLTAGEPGTAPPPGSLCTLRNDGCRVHEEQSKWARFDSNDSAFEFKLGLQEVIKGWDAAVATMNKGEKAMVVLRGDYAYGAQGDPGTCDADEIPPNATLRFEITLDSWEPGALPAKAKSKACQLL